MVDEATRSKRCSIPLADRLRDGSCAGAADFVEQRQAAGVWHGVLPLGAAGPYREAAGCGQRVVVVRGIGQRGGFVVSSGRVGRSRTWRIGESSRARPARGMPAVVMAIAVRTSSRLARALPARAPRGMAP